MKVSWFLSLRPWKQCQLFGSGRECACRSSVGLLWGAAPERPPERVPCGMAHNLTRSHPHPSHPHTLTCSPLIYILTSSPLTPSHSHSLSPAPSHSHILSPPNPHILSPHTLTLSHAHTLTLSQPHMLTPSHTTAHTDTPAHACAHTHSCSHTCIHTHVHVP